MVYRTSNFALSKSNSPIDGWSPFREGSIDMMMRGGGEVVASEERVYTEVLGVVVCLQIFECIYFYFIRLDQGLPLTMYS